MDKKIALFDSGVGGLAVLKRAKQLLPQEDFVYFADNKNMPFGNKTQREIMDIVCDKVGKIVKTKPKAVVIACNTATSICIDTLKKVYPDVLFVGTRPCVKDVKKPCVVFVTNGTANSAIGHALSKQKDVYLFVLQNGAQMIEDGCSDKRFKKYLEDLLSGINLFSFKSMVLGCTHYIHKKHVFESFGLQVYDNATFVAKQLESELKKSGLVKKSKTKGSVTFLLSDNKSQHFKKYIDFFNKV